MSEISLLSFTAAVIAVAHTILGPDHYLPFVAMAKARGWSIARTLKLTLWCGLGHIVGSVLLGVIGVAVGAQLTSLTWIEGVRGDLAAWGLLTLGLVYFAWGLRHAYQRKDQIEHGVMHGHHHLALPGVTHDHQHQTLNITGSLTRSEHDASSETRSKSIYWALFIVFVLGPCEALIPLLMYPAASGNIEGAIIVSLVFATATVLTMLVAVAVTAWGLSFVKIPSFERFSHAIAASTIVMCGASIVFLGL